MPTFVHGKSADFQIDDTAGTIRVISDVLNSIDFPETVETAETTAFGNTAKTYIVGLTDSSLSISGMWDSTVDGYINGGAEPASRSFVYGPAGSGSGAVKYSGECIRTSYDKGVAVGDVIPFSVNFQVTGAVTRGTYA
jgi:hypothetical protein